MSNSDSRLQNRWPLVVGGGAVVLLLVVLLVNPRREPDVNSRLAETARRAVESADEAHRRNDFAHLVHGRYRILALALGVTVPVIAAVVFAWLLLRRAPADGEMLAQLQKCRRGLESRRPPDLLDAASEAASAPAQVEGTSQSTGRELPEQDAVKNR